jgi:hypothetical protein
VTKRCRKRRKRNSDGIVWSWGLHHLDSVNGQKEATWPGS